MRIGILRGQGVTDIDQLTADLADAQSAGFTSYWLPKVELQADSLIALAVAGSRVPGIELGAGIVPIWTQHPLALGQSALTAASVLGDRLALGVGIVNKPVVEGTWGIPFERPITVMREYVEILQSVLGNEVTHYDGELISAHAAPVLPGVARPPLYMAALGPQMTRLAGKHSDGAILFLTGPITVKTHSRPLLSASAQAACRPRPRVIVGVPVVCTDDVARGRALIEQHYAWYGTAPHYRAMLDIEGANSPADVAIIGNESAVKARLEALFEAGADDVICYELGSTLAEVARTRACLAEIIARQPAIPDAIE